MRADRGLDRPGARQASTTPETARAVEREVAGQRGRVPALRLGAGTARWRCVVRRGVRNLHAGASAARGKARAAA